MANATAPLNRVGDLLESLEDDLWGADVPEQERSILRAAIDLFSEFGFHAATTRQIASRVQISPAGVYVRFRSKKEILFAICSAAHRVTDELLSETLVEPRSIDGLAGAMGRFARWHAEHQRLARVTQYELYALDEESRLSINESRRRSQDRVKTYVKALVRDGSIELKDIRSMTRGLMSLCIDVCRWYDPSGPLRPSAIEKTYADLAGRMLRG